MRYIAAAVDFTLGQLQSNFGKQRPPNFRIFFETQRDSFSKAGTYMK